MDSESIENISYSSFCHGKDGRDRTQSAFYSSAAKSLDYVMVRLSSPREERRGFQENTEQISPHLLLLFSRR